MPQINRIRVNNVKYNFGTQYYDDFVMRFSGKNTIYDLANGGGKSLLMMLLLQNMIPNCTLDDKQPIEKLFRAGSGNTTIHSLVEWKLDPCYMKENYKYMTTGFCARKGKGNEAEEGADSTAIVETPVSGASTQAAVEYFNYVIFYREFGENDIRNLPLTNGEERITYNGLKNYLRDLEKKDFNVSVRIFERKGDYQSFISQYGIFESEWEIIRGINKTEGHVRTYFETSYKTSRKVVEDLLIEEIIQKSFNNRLGVDNDEGKMAQTLIDIKDKLVELSKKNAQMSAYDSQVNSIEEFARYVKTFQDVYEKKESLAHNLYDMYIACKSRSNQNGEEAEKLEQAIEHIKSEMTNEQKAIQTAEVMAEQRSLDKIRSLVAETLDKKANYLQAYDDLKNKLIIQESANDYRDYLEYQKALDEISVVINNRLRDHDDLIGELRTLAVEKYKRNESQTADLTAKIEEAVSAFKTSNAELEEFKKAERDADRLSAVLENKSQNLQDNITELETTIKNLMDSGLVLVAENAGEAISELENETNLNKSQLRINTDSFKTYSTKLKECVENINKAEVTIEFLKAQIAELENMDSQADAEKKRFENLLSVYNEGEIKQLINTILTMHNNMSMELSKDKAAKQELENYYNDLAGKTYVHRDKHYNDVKDYLVRHYGTDVVDGREWFAALNVGQKRDVIKRIPFIEYAFIIKDDFERIKADTTLQNFAKSSYVLPIVSENIIYDTKLEVNTELVTFAMKDLAFLQDESRVEAEKKTVKEEIETLQLKIDKMADRIQVVREDYSFALLYDSKNASLDRISIEDKKNELEKTKEDKQLLEENRVKLEDRCNSLQSENEALEKKINQSEKDIDKLLRIQETSDLLKEKYNALEECKEKSKKALEEAQQTVAVLSEATAKTEQTQELVNILENELAKVNDEWNNIYSNYYDSNSVADEKLDALTDSELDSRFMGIKTVLEKETSDLSDKETLINTYKTSMEKCKASIEYRGSDFESIKQDYDNKVIYSCEAKILFDLKAKAKQSETDMKKFDNELDSQNALLNRLEGSIEHGRNQIIDKFGSFEEFECDNPSVFVDQHKALIKRLIENQKATENKLNAVQKASKDQMLMEKDLERIVRNAGMEIPDNIEESNAAVEVDFNQYEEVQKRFEDILKLENKKREEFRKKKEVLVNLLTGFNGVELAREVSASVEVPDSIASTNELIDNLLETNSLIVLEKDRIKKSVEDMERIKDNFENRCIQTCSNIKTELDRLPKLSNITMDNELISMIGLQIPYVKEEFFKDRMSSYIDETVVGAESFKNPEERLKYIRNRLTWKKLFSVIVTDMNAIRITLYKRERIKDQSRYLRYEEAVGSTGQSQGIYIQFLIAIINYISNINASSHETASLGKTIFIDNPFGAAKDIYIWEPIFKLLKTNHIQLIVPARGATPAITGRFEVNYILGQKLVNGRQQTVVVDYHSQVTESQLEYSRMDYEQTTLDLF